MKPFGSRRYARLADLWYQAWRGSSDIEGLAPLRIKLVWRDRLTHPNFKFACQRDWFDNLKGDSSNA
jgi:hypothetical protein